MYVIWIFVITMLNLSCGENRGNAQSNGETTTQPTNETTLSTPPLTSLSLHDDDKNVRVKINGTLTKNAQAVLRAAFDTDYPESEDKVNAYDFPLYHGNKGMDWWNFPWDLNSSHPEMRITYNDMKEMLERVMVRKTKNAHEFISYADMLKEMVQKLTPGIMQAHGGYARVVKIIYCIRNFLSVAIKYNLTKDIPPLKIAAKKLIELFDSGQLGPGTSSFGMRYGDVCKNSDGQIEERSAEAGVKELKRMLNS